MDVVFQTVGYLICTYCSKSRVVGRCKFTVDISAHLTINFSDASKTPISFIVLSLDFFCAKVFGCSVQLN